MWKSSMHWLGQDHRKRRPGAGGDDIEMHAIKMIDAILAQCPEWYAAAASECQPRIEAFIVEQLGAGQLGQDQGKMPPLELGSRVAEDFQSCLITIQYLAMRAHP